MCAHTQTSHWFVFACAVIKNFCLLRLLCFLASRANRSLWSRVLHCSPVADRSHQVVDFVVRISNDDITIDHHLQHSHQPFLCPVTIAEYWCNTLSYVYMWTTHNIGHISILIIAASICAHTAAGGVCSIGLDWLAMHRVCQTFHLPLKPFWFHFAVHTESESPPPPRALAATDRRGCVGVCNSPCPEAMLVTSRTYVHKYIVHVCTYVHEFVRDCRLCGAPSCWKSSIMVKSSNRKTCYYVVLVRFQSLQIVFDRCSVKGLATSRTSTHLFFSKACLDVDTMYVLTSKAIPLCTVDYAVTKMVFLRTKRSRLFLIAIYDLDEDMQLLCLQHRVDLKKVSSWWFSAEISWSRNQLQASYMYLLSWRCPFLALSSAYLDRRLPS